MLCYLLHKHILCSCNYILPLRVSYFQILQSTVVCFGVLLCLFFQFFLQFPVLLFCKTHRKKIGLANKPLISFKSNQAYLTFFWLPEVFVDRIVKLPYVTEILFLEGLCED